VEPGKAMQTILQVNAGNQGWNGAAEATGSIRAVTSSNAGGLASHITGPLGTRPTTTRRSKHSDQVK